MFTVPLMFLQWAFLLLNSKYKKNFPHWYHKNVCKIIGIQLHISGKIAENKPILLISNHTSWLDITILSAITPLSFVAKKEVASWPFFGWLAILQRTVFVDRERRTKSGQTANEITTRLKEGDRIVLFAEGTSNNGNGIRPFKTALFAAADLKYNDKDTNELYEPAIEVQTIAVAYTHRHGLPLGRKGRPKIAWYGDMDLLSHMWNVFADGPYDIHIQISEPIKMENIKDRKELAKYSENSVRNNLASLLQRAV